LLQTAQQVEQDYQQTARVLKLVDAILPAQCAVPIQAMLAILRQIAQAERALEQFDLSDFEQLEAELAKLKEQYQAEEQALRQLVEQAGELKERERTCGNKVKQFADAQETFQEAQEALEEEVLRLARHYPEVDAERALQEASERAEKAGENFDFSEDMALQSQRLATL